MNKVDIYSIGIVYLSACAEDSLSIEEITTEVNKLHPTKISSKWTLSEDKTFKDGISTNPCKCNQHSNRLHYLFTC